MSKYTISEKLSNNELNEFYSMIFLNLIGQVVKNYTYKIIHCTIKHQINILLSI